MIRTPSVGSLRLLLRRYLPGHVRVLNQATGVQGTLLKVGHKLAHYQTATGLHSAPIGQVRLLLHSFERLVLPPDNPLLVALAREMLTADSGLDFSRPSPVDYGFHPRYSSWVASVSFPAQPAYRSPVTLSLYECGQLAVSEGWVPWSRVEAYLVRQHIAVDRMQAGVHFVQLPPLYQSPATP